MDINELYLHQFKSFLLKAKLHGYAGGDRLKIRSSDFSKKYLYEEDEFSYEDRYFGEFVDMGQEIVRYKGIPVWGMSYRGGIFSLYDDNKQKVFNFLRLALNEVDNQLPIRGPTLYQNGTYTYLQLIIRIILIMMIKILSIKKLNAAKLAYHIRL